MNLSDAPDFSRPRCFASYPFSDPDDADIVLHSSDGVEFYTYKVLLSITSGFFKDMFSLAQASNGHTDTNLPSVDLSEDSQTLVNLFSFVDPRVIYPTLSLRFEEIMEVARAADKYQMDIVHEKLSPSLKSPSFTDPVEAFISVSSFALQGKQWAITVSRAAALATLQQPIDAILRANSTPQTGREIVRLMNFHTLCGEEAERIVRQYHPATANPVWVAWKVANDASTPYDFPQCSCTKNTTSTEPDGFVELHYVYKYRKSVADAVVRRPLGVVHHKTTGSEAPRGSGLGAGCLEKMKKSCRIQFLQLDVELAGAIEAALENVSIFLSPNTSPRAMELTA